MKSSDDEAARANAIRSISPCQQPSVSFGDSAGAEAPCATCSNHLPGSYKRETPHDAGRTVGLQQHCRFRAYTSPGNSWCRVLSLRLSARAWSAGDVVEHANPVVQWCQAWQHRTQGFIPHTKPHRGGTAPSHRLGLTFLVTDHNRKTRTGISKQNRSLDMYAISLEEGQQFLRSDQVMDTSRYIHLKKRRTSQGSQHYELYV